MVIFHTYVKLPEGTLRYSNMVCWKINYEFSFCDFSIETETPFLVVRVNDVNEQIWVNYSDLTATSLGTMVFFEGTNPLLWP